MQPVISRSRRRQTAFTLIELLVVIVVVGVLAAIALPIYGRVIAKGNETKTYSNMRQMGIGLLAYAGDNSYMLPNRVQPAAPGTTVPDKWPRLLQPYIQDLRVYGSPLTDVGGKTYKVTDQQLYLSNTTNYTSYIYNGGNDVQESGTDQSFPRLNSLAEANDVILLGIPYPQANNFYMDFSEGNNNDVLNKTAFADGTPYVFCDGSTRILKVVANTDNTVRPLDSGAYSDWLWLFNKQRADLIK